MDNYANNFSVCKANFIAFFSGCFQSFYVLREDTSKKTALSFLSIFSSGWGFCGHT